MTTISWGEEREQFPILRNRSYFASPSFGVPHVKSEELLDYYRASQVHRPNVSYEWMGAFESMHGEIERLLNAPEHSVFMAPSVTAAQQCVAASIAATGKGFEVWVDESNFNSGRYVWKGLEGIQKRTAWGHDAPWRAYDNFDTQAFLGNAPMVFENMHESLAAIVLPLVSPVTGRLLDIAPFVERAKETGTMVIVDAFHAVGIVDVDVQALGADVVLGGMSKWVGGTSLGCCFGYLGPRFLARFKPAFPGYFGHAGTFAFEDKWRPAPGARAWQAGAPAIEPIYGAVANLEWINRVGIKNIRARSQRLTRCIVRECLENCLNMISPTKDEERGGMVVLKIANAERIAEQLAKEHGVDVDNGIRPNTIRIGPHPCMGFKECNDVVRMIAGYAS